MQIPDKKVREIIKDLKWLEGIVGFTDDKQRINNQIEYLEKGVK